MRLHQQSFSRHGISGWLWFTAWSSSKVELVQVKVKRKGACSVQTNSSHRRRASENISAEQAKRLEYLERIVQGYVGSKDALDLETLKGLAQGVEKRRNSPRPADISSQSSEFDGVDEKFDIQPLHGNVTRMSPHLVFLSSSKDANMRARLLWRVFALELFHAHQEVDRPECPKRLFQCKCSPGCSY